MRNKLEVLTAFLDKHPEAQAVAGVLEFVDDRGKILHRLGGVNYSCAANMIDWCQPMFRRTLIDKIGKLAEHTIANADADYFMRLTNNAIIMYGSPLVLDQANVRYRGTRGDRAKWERMLRGELME